MKDRLMTTFETLTKVENLMEEAIILRQKLAEFENRIGEAERELRNLEYRLRQLPKSANHPPFGTRRKKRRRLQPPPQRFS